MATSPMAAYILSSPDTGRFGPMAKGFEQSYAVTRENEKIKAKYRQEAALRRQSLANDLAVQYQKYQLEAQKKRLYGMEPEPLDYKASQKMFQKWMKVQDKLISDRNKGHIWSKDALFRKAAAGGVDYTLALAQAKDNPVAASIVEQINAIAGMLPEDERVWEMELSANPQEGRLSSEEIKYSTAKNLAQEYGGLVQQPNVITPKKGWFGRVAEEEQKSPFYSSNLTDREREIVSAYMAWQGGKKPPEEPMSVKQFKAALKKGIKFTTPPTVKLKEGTEISSIDELFNQDIANTAQIPKETTSEEGWWLQ